MPAHRLLALAFAYLFTSCADDDPIARRTEELGQNLANETEPNSGAVNATPIGRDVVVRAPIFPIGDQDYYQFDAVAGDRVYAATMTIGSAPNANSVLDLYMPDGTTVIENDDDDGVFGPSSSTIAGAAIPANGTYFLRVRHFNNVSMSNATLRPYDLHFRLQRGAPASEVAEPNDLAPQPLPASGWVAGDTLSPTDVDVYSIALGAGDTVFVSADFNPERDATSWNGQVSIGPFATTAILANDGSAAATASEALFATVQTAGTYTISVQTQMGATSFGTYRLSVSVHPGTAPTPTCTTYTSTDVPRAIGPGATQVTSTIIVPGSPRIADVDVAFRGSHSAIAELDVRLRSPAGNDVGLFTDIGNASTLGNIDMLIDEEAALPLIVLPPQVTAFSGANFQTEPDYRLHWFDGENGGGTWTLVIDDDVMNTNGGTLDAWALTICEPTPAVCPVGGGAPASLVSIDFEGGASGFTHSGTSDEWALGTPTNAVINTCNSGTQCWKTDLVGTYEAGSSQDLVSAPISLAGLSPPIRVSWAMRYQMDIANNDHANVRIREAGTGAGERTLWEFLDNTMTSTFGTTSVNESAGWGVHTFDISAYAGRTVELVFHVDSDGATNLAGLAVDDVGVTHCGLCGNGALEGVEQCDHGAANGTAGDCCSSTCTFVSSTTVCRASGGACDSAEMCDGAGSCPADTLAPNTTVCRPAVAGGCDVPETCTGSSAACPSDTVAAGGTPCRTQAGACDVAESCDGTSNACPADVLAASGVECRASAGACDTAEACTGSSAACPADAFASSGVCRGPAGPCDTAESCDGSGPNCPADVFASTGVCRVSVGACDPAESCNGSGAACPADVLSGSSTTCRAAVPGGCDVAEVCNGSDPGCPADVVASNGTTCRPSAGVCDSAETCNGTSNSCPSDSFASGTTCRASAGACDVAETCNGSGPVCPSDAFATSGTCRPAVAGGCDVAESCNGSGADCPADGFASASTVCRTSAGSCDVPENCTGSSAACPSDGFAGSGTTCRPTAGACDVAETCSGSAAACPSDGFASSGTSCRAAAGPCDVPESCTGSGASCPVDQLASAGTTCRATAGSCDVAEACDGALAACPPDTFRAAGATCRPSAGICDAVESCSGADAACPNDSVLVAGTQCRASAGDCDVPESCDGSNVACPADVLASAGSACRASAGPCDVPETCTGASTTCPADAVEPSGVTCRASAGSCDDAEVCDGSSTSCPADLGSADGTPCDDTDACTRTDVCTGRVCTGGNRVVCTASDSCHLVGSCNPLTGMCTDPQAPDGTACVDSDVCNGTERCMGGTCMPGAALSCDDGDDCTVDSCDPVDGCQSAGECDAGMPDAGMTSDAGMTTDAGMDASVDEDAGSPIDAGTEEDAGSAAGDAGAFDGGLGDGGMVEEDGGCGCRAAESSRSPLVPFVLAALAVVVRVRRRRV